MAIGTPTILRTAGSNTAAVTTASFTPTAGALLIVDYGGRIAAATGGEPTITDSIGLTWTAAYSGMRDPGGTVPRQRLKGWTATAPTTPAAMTVTVGATDAVRSSVAVREITGAQVTTNFAPAISPNNSTSAIGRPTVTLPTAPAATSTVLIATAMTGGNAIGPPAGFTELSEVLQGTDWTLETGYIAASSPTTFQWPVNSNSGAVGAGIEITAATTGGAAGFTETLALTDTMGAAVYAVSTGFTETLALTDSSGSLNLPGGGSPENPAGCWSGATGSWRMPGGQDSKGTNDLTVSGVTSDTLAGPAGTFAATSYARRTAPTFASLTALTVECWVEPTAFGRIFRIGDRSLTAGTKISVFSDGTGAYNLKRTVGTATQQSISAAGVAVIGTAHHLVAVFPANAPHRLYINGAAVTLTHTGANINAAVTIASGDEVAIGASDAVDVAPILTISVSPGGYDAVLEGEETRFRVTRSAGLVGNCSCTGIFTVTGTNANNLLDLGTLDERTHTVNFVEGDGDIHHFGMPTLARTGAQGTRTITGTISAPTGGATIATPATATATLNDA